MSKIAADSISSRSGGNIAINNNINVVGVVTAIGFVGSGVGITGINGKSAAMTIIFS